MFPYPSNSGLHVGHPVGYIYSDILHKYAESRCLDSLRVMGWDSFGLPTEQYSIITKTHPAISTKKNVFNFKNQLHRCAILFNWSKSFKTTDKEFYKWTQYIFLLLVKKGYCYVKNSPIIWCSKLNTVLSAEEVDCDGLSERGKHFTKYKFLNQWVLKIKKHSLSYINSLNFINWPIQTKNMQSRWIGVHRGRYTYTTTNTKQFLAKVTLKWNFWCIFFIKKFKIPSLFTHKIYSALPTKLHKKLFQKTSLNLNKTKGFGIPNIQVNLFLNRTSVELCTTKNSKLGGGTHPTLNKFSFIFFWSVLVFTYAKGIKKRSLTLINSLQYDSIVTSFLKLNYWVRLIGLERVRFKLKDWVFSRQRYWGEPFPIVWLDIKTYMQLCSFNILNRCLFNNLPTYPIRKGSGLSYLLCIPLPLKNLPLRIEPFNKKKRTLHFIDIRRGFGGFTYKPKEVVLFKFGLRTSCLREVNVMPQWAGSSWYYLKYMDSVNKKGFLLKSNLKKWNKPDIYVGGSEHAVLHLLYARFWNYTLHEQKRLYTKEPFKDLKHQGLVLTKVKVYRNLYVKKKQSLVLKKYNFITKNIKKPLITYFKKMSKSSGVSLNPLKITNRFGLDSFRVYEMLKPICESKVWSTRSLSEISFSLKNAYLSVFNKKFIRLKEGLIFNIRVLDFNNVHTTLNQLCKVFKKNNTQDFIKNLRTLYLYTPVISEELWLRLGFLKKISLSYIPAPNDSLL